MAPQKTENILKMSETHVSFVFGARGALAVAGCLSGWNHSYLLYWHAAVSRQRPVLLPQHS